VGGFFGRLHRSGGKGGQRAKAFAKKVYHKSCDLNKLQKIVHRRRGFACDAIHMASADSHQSGADT
jgi:CRISPR/Cas system-associated endonuclease/helicase Cas3